MSVTINLQLFLKPGQELEEGSTVTAEQLLFLADTLQRRLRLAAYALIALEKHGWHSEMNLSSITLVGGEGSQSLADTEALLDELGIDRDSIDLDTDHCDDEDDEDEDDEDDEETTNATQAQCPDCGVEPGNFHKLGCDIERCPYCDDQLLSCVHFAFGVIEPPSLADRMEWTGEM